MTQSEKTSKTIHSVDNAIHILDELLSQERAGVTELSEAVGLSKSTVHHYLATLRQHDFVERADGRYQLGFRPLSYGGAARERSTVFQTSKQGVDRLASKTGETARLVVKRDDHTITLYQSTATDRQEIRTALGTREDLHSTAAGKAMLATMNDDRLNAFLEHRELPQHTENTIVDAANLWTEINDIRSQGIAFDDEEQFEGVRCVATALVTDDEKLLGALSVSSSNDQFPDERFYEEIPQLLQNVAGVIEINTTYRGWME